MTLPESRYVLLAFCESRGLQVIFSACSDLVRIVDPELGPDYVLALTTHAMERMSAPKIIDLIDFRFPPPPDDWLDEWEEDL